MKGVSLDIANGEFVSLVGPSGCGKSTLLRMIAGLEDISGGDLMIDGRRMNAVAAKRRNIAMVFQNYALYPHMTVAENMGFSLRIKGLPKAEIATQVRQAADVVGLGDYLDRLPRQLSGGQRQRVAMARAIVRHPAAFLFDEPLSNLDAKLRVQMRSEIKSLHQRLGTTTIYVTHDQIEAMTMADRIVVMNVGEVEQEGAPLTLYDHPESVFVAGFIGSPAMNLIEGTLSPDGFTAGPLTVPVRARATGPAILGVRPEHLILDPEGHAATVALVEPTGAETQVHLDLAGHKLTGVFRERIADAPGSTLHVRFDPDRLHLFDRETGKRIATP